jgi:hypothetical protein
MAIDDAEMGGTPRHGRYKRDLGSVAVDQGRVENCRYRAARVLIEIAVDPDLLGKRNGTCQCGGMLYA